MRRTVAALAIVALTGCAILPTSGDYYTPSASEGYVEGYGDNYAPTTLVLKRGKDGDIVVRVNGYFLGGSQVQNVRPSLEIRLYVPRGKALKIDLSAVHVYSSDSTRLGTASSVYAMNRTQLHGDLKMDVASQSYSGDALPFHGNTLFYAVIPIEGVPPKAFNVELPTMGADGISYPSLTITFTYTHGWWWQYYGP